MRTFEQYLNEALQTPVETEYYGKKFSTYKAKVRDLEFEITFRGPKELEVEPDAEQIKKAAKANWKKDDKFNAYGVDYDYDNKKYQTNIDEIKDYIYIFTPEITITSIKVNGQSVSKALHPELGHIYRQLQIQFTKKGKEKIFKAINDKKEFVDLDNKKDYIVNTKESYLEKEVVSGLYNYSYSKQAIATLNNIYEPKSRSKFRDTGEKFVGNAEYSWKEDLEEALGQIFRTSNFVYYTMLPTDGLRLAIIFTIPDPDED